MKQYQVKMTFQAEENVLEYVEYIKTELLGSQGAIKFVEDMRAVVKAFALCHSEIH